MSTLKKTPSLKRAVTQPMEPIKALKQSYLDFGQAKFSNVTCNKCGMLYSPGPEDDAHARFCKARSSHVTYKLGKDSLIAGDYKEDGVVVVGSLSDSRCKRLRELVEDALGFCRDENDGRNITNFVFVRDSRALGYLETNSIRDLMGIVKASDASSVASSEVEFGILKIWVHSEERRKGVATKLVDAARGYLGYPAAVPRHRVAFSPPTELGSLFAKSYVGTADFAVFKL